MLIKSSVDQRHKYLFFTGGGNMNKTKILLVAQSVLLCLFVSMVNAEMSSTSYRISTTVMSGGGNTLSSDNFGMVSTLGQPTVLGNGSSFSYRS